ncbi:MAG: hypothetical protein AABY64_13605 [Bdellovibrionota bacterium]
MKNIVMIISVVCLSFGTAKAATLMSQAVESCTSVTNLDWYIEVLPVGNNKYELINYKLVAKSPWHGNEYYKRVYSRIANVSRSAINKNYTVYSGEEFGPMQLKIDAPIGAKGSNLKATLYVLLRNFEDYQRYPFVCTRY